MNYDSLLDRIKKNEGFSSSAYTDSLGYLTIGYGRLIDKKLGGGITKEEAEFLLANDVKKSKDSVDGILEQRGIKDLPEVVYSVLIELMFMLGKTKFLKFKGFLSAIASKDYKRAALELKYANVEQKTESNLYKQIPNRVNSLIALLEM